MTKPKLVHIATATPQAPALEGMTPLGVKPPGVTPLGVTATEAGVPITTRAPGFDPQDVVVLLVKDRRTQVWAYSRVYLGLSHFHVREVYLNVDDQWAPGKHGLSVRLERRDELIAAFAALSKPH